MRSRTPPESAGHAAGRGILVMLLMAMGAFAAACVLALTVLALVD